MVKFDLSGNQNVIKSLKKAGLSICYVSGSVGNKGSTLYPISKDIVVSEATWNEYAKGKKWDKVGGDYDENKTAFSPYAKKAKEWETFDVTNLLKSAYSSFDGTPHYGFIIIADEGVSAMNMGRFYASSENSDQSIRPKLELESDISGIIPSKKTNYTTFAFSHIQGRIYLTGLKMSKSSIQITSINGSSLLEFTVANKSSVTLPVSNLAKGIYFLQIRTDLNENATFKFIHN